MDGLKRSLPGALANRIRFDRQEFAGAFGDFGTSLPLLIALIPATGADSVSVFVVFGLAQIFAGLAYGVPMPAQPLKVVAALAIAGNMDASIVYGAGLSAGVVMMAMTMTGLLDWLARLVPKAVVRGIQLGVGLKLALLALTYTGADGGSGYVLAAVCFVVTLALFSRRSIPPALAIVALGIVYALVTKRVDLDAVGAGWGLTLPQLYVPNTTDLVQGFLLLSLPQIPLSLGNSVLATRQLAHDLFPEKEVTARKIGFTYSLINLTAPFFSGIPMCHGSGGMAGMHVFGARTGGAPVIYGSMFVVLGLFFGQVSTEMTAAFPRPVLGILLLFQALALATLVRDMAGDAAGFSIALLVGIVAIGLPYGFLVGLVLGTALAYVLPWLGLSLSSNTQQKLKNEVDR